MPYRVPEYWSLAGAILIGLISGFVSVTRRMGNKTVSRLWVLSEGSGVVLVTLLALDIYPQIKPTLMASPSTSWITLWVFVGVLAHASSRIMYFFEKKVLKRFPHE